MIKNFNDKLALDFSKKFKNYHVYFRDIEEGLIKHINKADIIVGCVAWLTSKKILKALSKKKYVSIIVQKENFWDRSKEIKDLYKSVQSNLHTYFFGDTVLNSACPHSNTLIKGILCVGSYNKYNRVAWPRMHHKFLVFAKWKKHKDGNNWIIDPKAIWTGSYNLTYGASRSLENAVYIKDSRLAKAFLNEYAQIAIHAEQMNWNNEEMSPQWKKYKSKKKSSKRS